ncbi:MAG: Asp-tRNA(Asn)/Glu-tRNA(Gln) amidotransferase GatCAB subunit B, partial [Actinomycetota bacterium]
RPGIVRPASSSQCRVSCTTAPPAEVRSHWRSASCCEIKNLNSLRSLVRAIEHEAERQWDLTSAGGAVVQETRHWDEDAGRTIPGRSKEEAHDYRYFPEPDLVPVAPTAEMRERVRASMPELPAARRSRLVAEWGIKDDDARVLVDVAGLADYAERAVAALADGGTARDVVNWVRQEVLAHGNDSGAPPAELAPEMLAELVGLAAAGTISRVQAKDVLAESLAEGRWPRTIVEERGLAQVSDAGELGAVVDRVLAANPDVVAEFRAGDDKARKKKRGFIMGELMKELRGEGNPQVLNALLDERLA